ncbi:MAG: hypothetical protein NUV64_00965 [Parcubacteria group bacterium]|nr:hypothetical protein [Parcubacteria group bacterium]MCR4342684.1 hypothetical protein [Patescibacteria group bacterium]
MGKRKIEFANSEYYHIFNRGVDKRQIFLDQEDLSRFFQSMNEFNVREPIGSIYENSFRKLFGGEAAKLNEGEKLVNFICYCLNPNHYHFILEQVSDKGIEKFMQRLGGYTWYFNKKYERSGSLFQGPFKSVHIDSNEQLLHTSVYVNLNDKVHQLGGEAAKLVRSSWGEYMGNIQNTMVNIDNKIINNTNVAKNAKKSFCKKDIILDQFKNRDEYKDFAKEALSIIRENKEREKEMEKLLIE